MELFKLFGTIALDNSEANDAIDETTDKARSAGNEIKELGDEGEHSSNKLNKFFSGVGKVAGTVTKVIGAVSAVAGTAVVAIGKSAISSYADYEQLVGGVETLFKDSADTVIQNAENAYKTAGMSANEYMETVTSFSASLLQSLGGDTKAAADKADMAITDMSDNANKMGTSIEMIQNAYNGFAKQNYTMLDNLKLGYGGTKEEMERLLADAEKISGIKYDVSSYSDIVDAIHVVQTEMGITGTTAKEASSTISGSLASAKASWQNLLTGIADGNQDVGGLISQFFDSIVTVADNIIPRIAQIMETLPQLITELAPKLLGKVSDLMQQLLPGVVNGTVALVNSVVDILPNLTGTLVNILPALIDGFGQIVDGLIAASPAILTSLVEGLVLLLADVLPSLIDGIINFVVTVASNIGQIIQPLIDKLPDIIIDIVNALMNNLPALIQGAVALVIGIVQALPQIIMGLIEALPTVIQSILEGLWNALPLLLEGIITIVGEIGTAIWDILSGFFTALGEWFGGLWESIKTIFEPVIEWFGNLFNDAWEAIKNAWSAVTEFFSGIWDGISNAFADVGNFFKDMFSGAWDGIKSVWNSVTGFFSDIWKGISKTFGGVADFFKNIFQKAYNGITGIFSKIGGFFKDVFGALGNIIKAPINLVIKGLNVLINGLNKVGFDVPDWVPVIGGKRFGFNIKNIPELAKGGVVNKPTPAIFGEDGAEAVVPLEKNTGWIQNVAKQIHAFTIESKDKSKEIAPTTGLMGAIRTEIGDRIRNLEEIVASILDILKQFFPELLEAFDVSFVLDDGTLVAKLVPKINQELGNIIRREGR